ncbi:MAG: hypothetical protein K9G33_05330 [Sneathiella sp.]|nr:hypothetical protein [Sneathiella sp.]
MGFLNDWFSSNRDDNDKNIGETFNATILSSSLANAQLLMMTAAERGMILDDDIIQAILETQDAVQKKQLTPALAASFWQAYEALSHSLLPITVDSIRATHDLRQFRHGVWWYLQGKIYVPFSRKCAFRYKLLSTVTLLMLISLQVFWSIGNALVIDINSQSNSIVILKEKLFRTEGGSDAESGSDFSARSAANAAADTSAPADAQNPAATTVDIQELNRQIGEYISWRSAEIIELKNWNRYWGQFMFFTQETWEKPDYSNLSDEAKTHVHYVSAQYVLHAISSYFLPILYGLLGASFYVLRQLPKDIDNMTFSMNSNLDYSLRIAQGPLAGIMASFFFINDTAKIYSLTSSSAIESIKLGSANLSNFSPLAIAFLAGYSVELIFYVIDKIISVAIGKTPITVRQSTPVQKPLSMQKPPMHTGT